MDTYHAGAMARFDSFAGGCRTRLRVLDVVKPGNGKTFGSGLLRCKLLDSHGGYVKGEIMDIDSTAVVPCSKVIRRNGDTIINTDYQWS